MAEQQLSVVSPVEDTSKTGGPPPGSPVPGPATSTEGTAPPARSLVRKLAEVMAEVERVPKSGHNDHFNYDFVRESDLVEAVRGGLAKRQVTLTVGVLAVNDTPRGDKSFLTTVDLEFTWHDGESGEAMVVPFMGYGIDSQDKGLYKALTGAKKYFLLMSFLVATGDDPEQDGSSGAKSRRGEASASSRSSGPRGTKTSGGSPRPKPASRPSSNPGDAGRPATGSGSSGHPDVDRSGTVDLDAAWGLFEKEFAILCELVGKSASDVGRLYIAPECRRLHLSYPIRRNGQSHDAYTFRHFAKYVMSWTNDLRSGKREPLG